MQEVEKKMQSLFKEFDCKKTIDDIISEYQDIEDMLLYLYDSARSLQKENTSDKETLEILAKGAIELVSKDTPYFEYIAARFKLAAFMMQLQSHETALQITNFYDKVEYLTKEGLYGEYLLKTYTKEDIDMLSDYIDDSRNDLLTYSALDLLIKRYLIQNHDHMVLESPQEMFMAMAMHLALEEKERIVYAKKFYDIVSTWKVTMATPTMANARKPLPQLSSCFIDTVPDSLDGIYRSLDNFAKVSKFGGGMGLYFGKVRAQGASIRGYKGAAGGIVRWIKLVNDTAVAVDQLGMRQGAVAVYLDVWHKDVLEFLQLKTNNGDDRLKAHDIFPALCYPDLFWKWVDEDLNKEWYLMCPHEIKEIKGYCLEDYYGKEWETRYLDCVQDKRIDKRKVILKDMVRAILKSAIETGTPFTFNRDHVNKMNPNSHKGMIYCSNLCTEIAQNTRAMEIQTVEIKNEEEEVVVVETVKPGDFVVCNLASLALGNINVLDEAEMEEVISTVVRALDNVIDLNFYPVPFAKITSQKYRAIGLGVSGYHHMLAKAKIPWESEEHFTFVDTVFEKINYYSIKASNQLAKERGSYAYFAGSDWQTGEYFTKREYTSKNWQDLAKLVQQNGMRNGYLLAIAPTSSTSILASTTAGVDPILKRFYLEEKKDGMMPRVAPDLNQDTYWMYKGAHVIDQTFTIEAAAIRQRHNDQSQSVNIYINSEYTMKEILNLFLLAWKKGVKTLYYIRNQSLEVEECESCAS